MVKKKTNKKSVKKTKTTKKSKPSVRKKIKKPSKAKLLPEVSRICQDIKNLEIQGARNVAIMGLSAYVIEGLGMQEKNTKTFLKHLKNTSNYIKSLRPTEPMLFNFLDSVENKITKQKKVSDIKQTLYDSHRRFEELMRQNKIKISDHTLKYIKNGDIILTHCHSSTVVEALIHAKTKGRKFKVFATETRPRWQGHKTVRNLANAGVDVTLIPDGAFASVMSLYNIKKVMVGSDAIDKNGNFANKVGSFAIALVANHMKIPFYVLGESYKHDKRPKIIIELRDPSEVVDPKFFKGVKILNLAFDMVPAKYVTTYITEKGPISPKKYTPMAIKQIKHLLD